MHIRSLIFGAMLGILGAMFAVPTAMLAADLISPPPAYGPSR